LQEQKQLKTILMAGAEAFNKEPKDGFQYLQEKKILSTPLEPESVAEFLRRTTFVNKKVIGEYFGKDKEFNQSVIQCYCKTFDWKGLDVETAMRQLLESFRLPGEAQQIGRIVTTFSQEFMAQGLTSELADMDALELLAFSIIMLNVDQHSTKIKDADRMTLDQYIRNVRGQNGGKDFPQELVMNIYNRIKENEIKIPEEHLAEGVLDHAVWSHLVRKYSTQKDYAEFLETGVTAKCYDGMVYNVVWRVAHAALKAVITTTTDPELIIKVNDAFATCAEISNKLQLTGAFDNLIITLCDLSTILTSSSDRFLADFSNDKKAQLLTITLFTSARKYGDNLREGWRNILVCLIRLNALELLPALSDVEDVFPVKIDPKGMFLVPQLLLVALLTLSFRKITWRVSRTGSIADRRLQLVVVLVLRL
jgi:brefeldin A-resistance guanine nucleotide exchange factor 1